ncbi:NUDIX domain-containing protein [Pontibacter silvestris]|uniref:GDP-mannose pyrophosphatase n=1 Tax=Pontibacter silvestris TaxID=2305183 RepID=A0ABW4X2E0_9BACT|nr:NUDIX hydrolase [Pontibacter silvestris]MCC9135917.1 NUDIX hydrolase [Pontibacter silvestris]
MKIKQKETIYDGFYTFRKLTIEDKGDTYEREQFDSGDAAAAIVYDTDKDEYIFVKQYRYSAEMELLETVAGVVEEGDPAKTIRKEIEEESGYAVDHLEHVWDFFSSPGACTEKVHLFYAEVSKRKSKGGGLDEEHEAIKVISLSMEDLLTKKFLDAKTIIAVQWLASRHQVFLKSPEAKL